MKKIDLGQVLQLAANIAVVAGIAFLGYELVQNRQITRAQLRHDLAESVISQSLWLLENERMAEIVMTDDCVVTECSDLEYEKARQWIAVRFRHWEDLHYQYRVGLFDDSEYLPRREGLKRVWLPNPFLQEWWSENKSNFSRDFAAEIDLMISELSLK